MRTIQDVKIGEKVHHHEKGDGMVSAKTKRTITIVFERVVTKVTYRYNDDYFYVSDF